MNFTETDIQQIQDNKLTINEVKQQIQLFEIGISPINLKNSATIDNGILKFSKNQEKEFAAYFELQKENLELLKFVPASGAATRMFKFLYEFLENYNIKKESINSYINKNKATELSLFFIALEKLPFYKMVIQKLNKSNSKITSDSDKLSFVKTMLNNGGNCDYANTPKGLLPFHKYKEHTATAFGEHLFEAAQYASKKGIAKLHFTISEKHNHRFDVEFKRIEKVISKKTATNFKITFSNQKSKTDTIAVNLKNEPFRNKNGNLLFRPSGHGALIENLNDLDADIIFIKNIDNIVVYKYEDEVAHYKKVLAGLLLQLQAQIFEYQKVLELSDITEVIAIAIANFLYQKLNVVVDKDFEKFALKYQIEYLQNKINRPIRVCGMVKNEGEPGGGPFWVKAENGDISLQIVEAAQVDKSNKHQKEILKTATHFNPVDLVCGVKNYKGNKYNLLNFVDEKASFISVKSKNGKKLKALERPGLWNGAMANWNTIFVEVPLKTFNPVKTVNDLFKPAHQIS